MTIPVPPAGWVLRYQPEAAWLDELRAALTAGPDAEPDFVRIATNHKRIVPGALAFLYFGKPTFQVIALLRLTAEARPAEQIRVPGGAPLGPGRWAPYEVLALVDPPVGRDVLLAHSVLSELPIVRVGPASSVYALDDRWAAALFEVCGLDPEDYADWEPDAAPRIRPEAPSGKISAATYDALRAEHPPEPEQRAALNRIFEFVTDDLRRRYDTELLPRFSATDVKRVAAHYGCVLAPAGHAGGARLYVRAAGDGMKWGFEAPVAAKANLRGIQGDWDVLAPRESAAVWNDNLTSRPAAGQALQKWAKEAAAGLRGRRRIEFDAPATGLLATGERLGPAIVRDLELLFPLACRWWDAHPAPPLVIDRASDAVDFVRPVRVFVSYNHHNNAASEEWVLKLKEGLRAAAREDLPIEVFSSDDIPAGRWSDELDQQLGAADLVVLLVTDDAAASKHVGDEIEAAAKLGVDVLPVVFELGVDAKALVDRLEQFERVPKKGLVGASDETIAEVARKLRGWMTTIPR